MKPWIVFFLSSYHIACLSPKSPGFPSSRRAGAHEKRNNRRVVPSSNSQNGWYDCYGQRRRAVDRCLANVRARLDQRPHHNLVAVLSGDEQRRRAAIRRCVDFRRALISARTNSPWPD